ncbi:MAG: GNAT family N-acetyltransferase [Dehalococcoidales bacterium]|nr:GNAT family N-acetyltransferase [Dehalococcoidales bacterium]
MAAGPDNLVRLTGAQLEQGAETLVRAFQDYPLTVYFNPDPSARKTQMTGSFKSLLRFGVKYGEVYATSPEMEGVAMWLPSENADKTLWRQIRCGNYAALMGMLRNKPAAPRAYGEYSNAVRKRRAPVPYMYLQLLGVDPAYQGRGYSSRLLRGMFARIDGEGLPCFLETQVEKNVGIYEHFGFRVVEEGLVPGSEVKSWAMLREIRLY